MPQISLKYKALLPFIATLWMAVAGLTTLLPAAASAQSTSEKDAAVYKSAFKAAKSGNWKQADRIVKRATSLLPAKLLIWQRYTIPNNGASFSQIDEFIRNNPDWPRQTSLRRRAEEAMKNSLSDDEVLAWFGDKPPLTAAGASRYGRALQVKGRHAEATAYVRRAWRSLNMPRAEARDFHRRFRKLLRKQDHIDRLDRLIWDQQVSAARRQMRRVDRNHQHLAEARIQLMLRGGGVDHAIARVPTALQDHPGLVYERLRWRRRKGFTDRAIELLRDPPAALARPSKWWLERTILSRRALREGNITLAYRLAKEHKQTKGASYAEAEWLAGWIALRFLGDHDVALAHFSRLYQNVRYPVSRARGAYWTARAIEESSMDIEQRREAAKRWYRNAARHTTTFYGQLSIDHLRRQQMTQPPREPSPTPAQIRAFNSLETVRATHLLAALKQDHLVKAFVLHLAETAKRPAEWTLVAGLAADIGRNDLAIRVAKLAIRQGIALTVAGYPKLAVKRDFPVEPALIHAVIRQESAFDSRAVSRAGARGLMQLMPATAKQVARKLKIRHTKRKLISDPLHNMRLGSAYLEHLRNNYDGSLILTIAAYNAGPGNVNRWIRLNGDPRDFSTLDAIDWIEAIPVSETRNYVQRVLENLTIYGYRFDDGFLPEQIVDAMIGSETVDFP